ncbi:MULTISPECIES: EpsG family protein [unclassified Pseudoxanthomonas]|uniref:EpsG family protein n=1 Tax=unclassified Pseudoxanthomonas TaxID=2645906 RepID=UPI003077542D
MTTTTTILTARDSPLRPQQNTHSAAATGLSLILLLAVAVFTCWLIGTRPLELGTDTDAYAGFYQRLRGGLVETRLEPGFVYLSYALQKIGVSVVGYQTVLFALLLGTAAVATRRYFHYLGATAGFFTLLSASVMFLLISPMFVNASINAIRQGLAALLIFAALLAFHQRYWWKFALWGALATSFHYSSLLYLAFAPVLLLRPSFQRYLAAAAFLCYVSGLSMAAVRIALPSVYQLVMEYTATTRFESGVRIDFAVFSIFWYVLPHVLAPMVRFPYRERIKDSTAVYLVLLLPFFSVGWGFFSNRYLLPGWLAVSLILAAALCHNRVAFLRNPLLIRMCLVASCAVFYVLVTRAIVI